jgi:hypothetical protein
MPYGQTIWAVVVEAEAPLCGPRNYRDHVARLGTPARTPDRARRIFAFSLHGGRGRRSSLPVAGTNLGPLFHELFVGGWLLLVALGRSCR